MPKFLPPNHLSAHRIAAIALYRALLTQSRKISLPHDRQSELQNLLRARFKQWRNQQSTKQLRVAFCGGYQALDNLDAAVAGDQESMAYIVDLLGRVKDNAKQPDTRTRVAIAKAKTNLPSHSVLDRPRPLHELTGRRHIPRMISASGIPVLRIKKPQPPNLSAYITRRSKIRDRRTTLKQEIEAAIPLAEAEDDWDDLTTGYDIQAVDEESWTQAPRAAVALLEARRLAELDKNRVMARRMQDIIDQERTLVRIERGARRREAVRIRQQAAQKSKDNRSSSDDDVES